MFEVSQKGAIRIISTNKPMVSEALEEFQNTVSDVFAGGRPMAILNLENVPLLDSAALETLLEVASRFDRIGGGFKIAQPNLLCHDVLRMTGIDQKIEVHQQLADAVRSFVR